ncbi:MAG: hypothetical protein E7379_01635 [Clostridiales bacterium]|nr:hypothetical protein [Clostridiales bacterium]
MAISQEMMEQFVKLGDKKEVVTINGINYIGQKFITKGILLAKKGDNGQIYYVSESGLGLYLGQDNTKGHQFLSLYAKYDRDDFDLYINTIKDSKGNIIFKNEDYPAIKQRAYEKARIYKHNDNCLSAQGKQLLKLIGKPVQLCLPESFSNLKMKKVSIKAIICNQPNHDTIEFTDGFLHLSYPSYGCRVSLDEDAMAKLQATEAEEEIENE